jgi:Transglutaminase-like superfamily
VPSPGRGRRAARALPPPIRRAVARGLFVVGELWAIVVTTVLALRVEFLIRRRPLSAAAAACGVPLDTSHDLSQMPQVHHGVPTPPLSGTEARRLKALGRVMRHWPSMSGPWGSGTCLRESLLAGYYLRHRGPVLRVGAALVDGGPAFHAWIEVSGVDTGSIGFVPLVRTPQVRG